MDRGKRKGNTKESNNFKKQKGNEGEKKPKNNVWGPRINKENKKFEDYYKGQGLIPDSEWDQFLETLRADLPTTFRITSNSMFGDAIRKKLEEQYLHVTELKLADGSTIQPPRPVPWYPNNLAWYFNAPRKILRRNPELDELHKFIVAQSNCGNISRQEVVSMIPTCFLNVEPHHRVVDMCAAPGSKTGQILELLHANECKVFPTGVVVANDVDVGRCYTLVHQVQRLSSHCVLVVNHEAQSLPYIKMFPSPNSTVPVDGTNRVGKIDYQFDRVLCDVPCSGDGTFRKNLDLWKKWNVSSAIGLHTLQVRITARGAHLLKVGGRMVYSTCSLNPVEDEAVVAQVLRRFKGALRLVDVSSQLPGLKRNAGVSTWKVQDNDGTWYNSHNEITKPNRVTKIAKSTFPPTPEEAEGFELHKCMRVLPHHQDTGGFFVAVLEKVASSWGLNEDTEKESTTNNAQDKTKTEEKTIIETSEGKSEEKIEENPVDNIHPSFSSLAEKKRAGEDIATAVDSEEIPQDSEFPFEKKEPKGKRSEDPFLPFSPQMQPMWDSIKKFFGIKDSFPTDQIFVRSEKINTIYFVSPEIKEMLKNDDRGVLRVVNTGIKVFTKHDSKNMAYETDYRICSEGVKPLLSYVNNQRVVEITEADLTTLLTKKDPHIKLFSENAKNKINSIASGSFIMVLRPQTKPEWDGYAVAAWKGKVSCHLLATKEEADSLRYLMNIPIEHKKQKSKEKKREGGAKINGSNQVSAEVALEQPAKEEPKVDEPMDTKKEEGQ